MTFPVFPALRNLRYVHTIPDSFRVEHEQQRLQAAQRATSEFKNPHFQNEAKCTTFVVKMSFICMRMKNHFHIKG